MGSNDFFTVAYKILSYLKYCYEHGEQPDPGVINERTLLISKAQYVETLRMLSDHNYIEGVTFTHTKEGVLYSFQERVSRMLCKKGNFARVNWQF